MRGATWLLLSLAACNAEPLLYLGTPRLLDGGSDAAQADASMRDDGDDGDDDMPCRVQADCTSSRRPHCHEQLSQCVACLQDDDCDDDERCDLEEGDCDDER